MTLSTRLDPALTEITEGYVKTALAERFNVVRWMFGAPERERVEVPFEMLRQPSPLERLADILRRAQELTGPPRMAEPGQETVAAVARLVMEARIEVGQLLPPPPRPASPERHEFPEPSGFRSRIVPRPRR